MSMISPSIFGGCKILRVAITTNQIVTTHMKNRLISAPRTSALWYPKLYWSFAPLSAIFSATIEMPTPSASETRCAASDIMAIEFAHQPPKISTPTKSIVMITTITSLRIALAF